MTVEKLTRQEIYNYMLVKIAIFIIYHVLINRIYDFLYNYMLVKTATFTGIIIYHVLIIRIYY